MKYKNKFLSLILAICSFWGLVAGNSSVCSAAYNFNPKLVFLGDTAVGKTCIIHRLLHNQFNESTKCNVGFNCEVLNLEEDEGFDLFEVTGDEKRISMVPILLKDVEVVTIVVDLTEDKKRIEDGLKKWVRIQKKHAPNARCIIVGNKIDDSSFSEEKSNIAKLFAEDSNCKYIEVSAKTGENIDSLKADFNQFYKDEVMCTSEDVLENLNCAL